MQLTTNDSENGHPFCQKENGKMEREGEMKKWEVRTIPPCLIILGTHVNIVLKKNPWKKGGALSLWINLRYWGFKLSLTPHAKCGCQGWENWKHMWKVMSLSLCFSFFFFLLCSILCFLSYFFLRTHHPCFTKVFSGAQECSFDRFFSGGNVSPAVEWGDSMRGRGIKEKEEVKEEKEKKGTGVPQRE